MRRLLSAFGSLAMAVLLLVAIAAVLAWGTIYEARFGTAAVQRFVYHAWWFQGLLAFLGLNLTVAALARYPWQRPHVPFVLAHLGIILILLGGILGGRFGVEGQLLIPEGDAERTLQLPGHALIVRERNPGVDHVLRTAFETTAWNHAPGLVVPLPLHGRSVTLTVDQYYPDAAAEEEVGHDGSQENPAIQLAVRDGGHGDRAWLFANDPERFAARWQQAHLLFLQADTAEELQPLLAAPADVPARGALAIELTGLGVQRSIPVPDQPGAVVALDGTPYRVMFKDYFSDLAITEQGLVNRSDEPRNPAVSFILSGPEGDDPYLLFALHPDFQDVHGIRHTIPARIRFRHPAAADLPPDAVVVIRTPEGGLAAVMTDTAGARTPIAPLETGRAYRHPSLGYEVEVAAYAPRAVRRRRFVNRSDDVRAEAIHVVAREGGQSAEAWLAAGASAELPLGADPVLLSYRSPTRELPVTIKLLDFRKIDYPGTDMPSGFESDVELTDPTRGILLMRTIRMNHPLRYRGYSFYQSSYLTGPPETTVLSVRRDPGTPLVYTGFLIVLAGVLTMFIFRRPEERLA